MIRTAASLANSCTGNAAAELALVAPILLALMFGSVEFGNYFMANHVLEKQVRDGARFASRLEINGDYSCPDAVFQDPDADDKIINVTKTGAVSGSGKPRWTGYWTRTCSGQAQTVTVSIRCVPKDDIDQEATGKTGIYTSLGGAIPVVTVSGAVQYDSVLGSLGFPTANLCLRAESEAAVTGL
jgi:Flp pilus assembly protein TadG